MGCFIKKGSEKGSQKGVSRRCPERPLGEYDPWRAPYRQRELNGTRLMVHAGNCRQFFAVFRCFFAVFRLFLEIPELGERRFSQFFAVFHCFCSFSLFPLRAIKRVPLSALLYR